MINVISVLGNVLLFVALLIPGWILGKGKRISDDSIRGITAILTEVGMPFLVFVKLVETDFVKLGYTNILLAVGISVAFLLLAYILSPALFGKDDVVGRGCSIFSNCGFLGLPLAVLLFPDKPEIVSYVSLYNLVHTFFTLTLGITLFTGDRRHIKVRGILLKPVTFAIVLGVLCSLCNVKSFFPQVVDYSNLLANLCTPLSMIVLGVELAKFPLKRVFSLRIIAKTMFGKLVAAPLVMIAICFVLGMFLPVAKELSFAMFLSVGVSGASVISALSRTYNHDAKRASILVLSTTILCVVTLPIMSVVFEWVFR